MARLDIVPSKKLVRVEKVSWFGTTKVVYISPDDLEYVQEDDPLINSSTFWAQNRTYVDRRLMFRNKKTNEMFVFDRDGLWNPEGLKHPLIY